MICLDPRHCLLRLAHRRTPRLRPTRLRGLGRLIRCLFRGLGLETALEFITFPSFSWPPCRSDGSELKKSPPRHSNSRPLHSRCVEACRMKARALLSRSERSSRGARPAPHAWQSLEARWQERWPQESLREPCAPLFCTTSGPGSHSMIINFFGVSHACRLPLKTCSMLESCWQPESMRCS